MPTMAVVRLQPAALAGVSLGRMHPSVALVH